jgi:hypothetical protein
MPVNSVSMDLDITPSPNLIITPAVSSLPDGQFQVFEGLIIGFFGRSRPHASHMTCYTWSNEVHQHAIILMRQLRRTIRSQDPILSNPPVNVLP